MSLAATLAAGGLRPASFLPAIKCSACGHEIEIAAMGEHECSARPSADPVVEPAGSYSHEEWPSVDSDTWQEPWSAPAPLEETRPRLDSAAASNPYIMQSLNPFDDYDDHAYSPQPHHNDQHAPGELVVPTETVEPPVPSALSPPKAETLRPAYGNLPPIDSRAANKPYFDSDVTRSDSPLSPAPSARSRSRQATRPPPSPRPRLYDPRPPSKEMSTNMDCAFPPFPVTKPTHQDTNNGRKTPCEKFPARTTSRHGGRPKVEHDAEPKTPRILEGAMAFPQRMNSLPTENHNDTASFAFSPLNKNTGWADNGRRPSAPSFGAMGSDQHFIQPEGSVTDFDNGAHVPSAEQSYQQTPDDRTVLRELSPGKSSSNLAGQSPSHSQTHGGQDRGPAMQQGSSLGPIAGFDFSGSRSISPEKQVGQPIISHGASYSNSSTSSQHFDSNSSSHTYPSPITSTTSSVDMFSPFPFVGARHGDDDATRVAGLSVVSEQPGLRAEQPSRRSPPRNFARPAQAPPSLDIDGIDHGPPRMGDLNEPVESPMDPALHGNTLAIESGFPFDVDPRRPLNRTVTSPLPEPNLPQAFDAPAVPPEPPEESTASFPVRGSSLRNPARNRSKSSASASARSIPAREVGSANGNQRPRGQPLAPAAVKSQVPLSPRHVRRPTGRAICRGCGVAIEGKSVKAADGRLTGRWHKACFTCRTCEQPFTTADFYVLGNQPYCEQHYHERNGSLCHGCHRGIEGQYLEATSSGYNGDNDRKYHPRCFTCVECRQVLVDDYFEISGRVYCERHAHATMRAQSRQGGHSNGLYAQDRRAERRTTRLMMMGSMA